MIDTCLDFEKGLLDSPIDTGDRESESGEKREEKKGREEERHKWKQVDIRCLLLYYSQED